MPTYKPNYPQSPLNQTETIALARELSNQQIDIIRNNDEFGGEFIANRLLRLRNAVWGGKTGKPLAEDKQKEIFDDVLKKPDGTLIDPKHRELLLSSYAKMGHLYEIASLSARANTLANIDKSKEAIPGGSDELIHDKQNQSLTASQLVEKFNRPVFEVVMTAHPTNVNSLESMKAQREIDKALESKSQKDLTKALTEYQKAPIVIEKTEDGKKQAVNLTVRNETETALYFLGNIYEDLPKVYKNYDDALAKHAGSKDYDKIALNLNIRFGSWASAGDKDGNNKVTAETTLEAIALHTHAIVTRYAEDLEKINSPALQQWKTNFTAAKAQLDELLPKIVQLREKAQKNDGNTPQALSDGFDKLSEELAGIRNSLNGDNFENKKRFEEDLQKAAKSNDESLNLLRRFRTFGFNFSKIEYRETANEYSRVVGELVKGYNNLTPEQKAEKLTEILKNPQQSPLVSEGEYSSIVNSGAGRAYDKNNAAPIAYQTLKRMALARDFSDVIKDNVLAECGQIKANGNDITSKEIIDQGLANILEAQFLQRAVEKDKKLPKMGIIPLFEEPDTLGRIDKIMEAAYANEAYKKHLESIKENPADKKTQQVMIAHSDNAKRSGLQAARAYIHIAHHKMRELNKKNPDIQLQFFEGGSISDAYRNGVRSISKSVDAFGLHDFAKFTFQGGDLLNFFNHPAAINRLLESSIAHQAKSLTQENGQWVGKVKWSRDNSPDISENDRIAIEKNVNSSLKETLLDYKSGDFIKERMGILLAALGYKKVTLDSNASSRAGERNAEDNKPKENAAPNKQENSPIAFNGSKVTTGMGAAASDISKKENKSELLPIDIESVRTIGFSKTWQGAGIVPSWIGSLGLKGYLHDFFTKEKKPTIISSDKNNIENGNLTPQAIRKIYEYSPTFRDAQARAAFALAMTDMDSAIAIAEKKLRIEPEDDDRVQSYKKMGSNYLDLHINKTYKAAAELAYSAITGTSMNNSNLSNKAIRDKMVDALPHLKEDIINKTNYRAALLHWQITEPKLYEGQHMGRIAQAAKDTVEHGRWLGASDPSFANYIEKQKLEKQQQYIARR